MQNKPLRTGPMPFTLSRTPKYPMDENTFKMLEDGLKTLFRTNVDRDRSSGYNSNRSFGTAAAQAAEALMNLHEKFTPVPPQPKP